MKPDTYREHLNDLQVEVEELRAQLKEAQTGDTISRQAAIDALNDEFTITGKTNAIVIQDYIRRVNLRLHDLPSAQPEIVKCKDCAHGDFRPGARIYCKELETYLYQWDYCGRAERINNGQAD